jgi:iron complex outermembrane receptor protein
MPQHPQRSRRSTLPAFALSILACAINTAFAAEITDLGTVGTQANQSGTAPAASKAASIAPAQASLNATQPQATISHTFFEQAKSPVSDFTGIANIAPSVSGGISPNGPGLGESKNTIRGFSDGQYNVTWDGIPFGDTNGPTHHSTAYFPASIIDSITVERGPGNASNLGQATFGGSVNMFSPTPANELTFTPFAAFGSWNTQLYGVRIDSGNIGSLGDSRLLVSAQDLSSNGYRSNSSLEGKNFVLKLQSALTDSTLLTFFVDYNENYFYQPDKDNGLTMAQAEKFGKNYVLGDDPTKANYYKYNRTDKKTWMNYVRVQSDLGSGWNIDNNTYLYSYRNFTLTTDNASNPTAGLSSVKTINQATIPNQMPGYTKLNEYSVVGNIFKLTKQQDSGLLRLGLWLESADTHRASYDVNVLNMAANYKEAAVPGVGRDTKYNQDSGWNQYQPFIEYEWAAADGLTITPGLKYMHTELTVNAQVNQTARIAQNVSKDFTATLPFLTANYKIDPVNSVYLQYAQGMLVPDISSFQSANADATNIKPQTSTNYQLGTVHKTDHLTFDADLFYIDFSNKIAAIDPNATQQIFYNQGGVIYKGIEGQVTYAFDNGIALYGNASINSAKSKTSHQTIAQAPDRTAALGILYNVGGWSSALIYKYAGDQFVLDDAKYKLHGISTTDFSVGYTFLNPGWGTRSLKLNLGIYNLFDRQDVMTVKAANTDGTTSPADTFLFQPERSFMASLKAQF